MKTAIGLIILFFIYTDINCQTHKKFQLYDKKKLSGLVNKTFKEKFYFSHSNQNIKWTVVSGKFPPGLKFDSGVLSGVPKLSGTWTFKIKISNLFDQSASQTFSLLIIDSMEKIDAFELAKQRINLYRDNKHKDKMKIIWPNEKKAKKISEAECLLISGYINYTCVRFVLIENLIHVNRIKLKRTWFYNPKGESFESEKFILDSKKFLKTWHAIQLILRSSVIFKNPPAKSEGLRIGLSRFHTSSSHGSSFWVRLSKEKTPFFTNVVRGAYGTDRIIDYKFIKTKAIFKLINDLVSKNIGEKESIKNWGMFMSTQIKKATEELTFTSSDPNELLLECSFRVLGESGYFKGIKVIEAFLEKLTVNKNKKWKYKREKLEAEMALVKLKLLHHWSQEYAKKIIIEQSRNLHLKNDLIRWVRKLYYKKEPEAYFVFLQQNLINQKKNIKLMRETTKELKTRYPDKGLKSLSTLLNHADTDVKLDIAFLFLKNNIDKEKMIQKINLIAEDLKIPLHEEDTWISKCSRLRAIKFMCTEVSPLKERWSSAKIKQILNRPGEDGRIVHFLIKELNFDHLILSADQQIIAYKRALGGKLNNGVLLASKELIKLRNKDSIVLIEKALLEYEKELNKQTSDKNKKYFKLKEIENIRKTLNDLENPL